MTSSELYDKIRPSKTKEFTAQLTNDGLNNNISSIFCPLIKDAARCNRYQSDIYYSLKQIDEMMEQFNPNHMPEPIWIGFRRDGVDGTSFVLSRTGNDIYNLHKEYFALYSVTVEKDLEYSGFYKVLMNEYWM